jgi:hypothetical protein
VGSHSVTLICSDGSLSTPYILDVFITNTAPTFITNPPAIISITEKAPYIQNYFFPATNDLEGHTVNIYVSP